MNQLRGTRHWAQVQSEALDAAEVFRYLGEGNVGAIDIFVGKTRMFTEGRETVRLEYDIYTDMAIAEMSRIALEALDKWPVARVALVHRSGRVEIGEASVIVGASAPHRPAAFEACRFLIDTLKQRAPIWKQEHFADGGREWVGHDSATQNKVDIG